MGSPKHAREIVVNDFGKTQNGRSACLYELTNPNGMEVKITNFGASIVSMTAPDTAGNFEDVILDYDTLTEYEQDKAYLGATIGRYANRIAHGRLMLDGVVYRLRLNDGHNHSHGGFTGFNKRMWEEKHVSESEVQAVELSYLSKDGEEGYPGNLAVAVRFTLDANENALRIDYRAEGDKKTVVNLTNHSYFNLGGAGSADILKHRLSIRADKFTPVNADHIPTGEFQSVEESPFDFLHSVEIGARIDNDHHQLVFGKGYDHNWVLNRRSRHDAMLAAEVLDPTSGRVLQVLTTEPGLQLYTGNFLDGGIKGKQGKTYAFRSGFCLETQHFPDSPNHDNFPSTVLSPGMHFASTTVFRFLTR